MKTTTPILLVKLAAVLLLSGCATQIQEGPTAPASSATHSTTSAAKPRPSVTPRPAASATPKPTPKPAARPTPYPIPQKPDTGASPLAPATDQPIWQRTE